MRIALVRLFLGSQLLGVRTSLDWDARQTIVWNNMYEAYNIQKTNDAETHVKTPEAGTTHFWTPMGGVSMALSSPR